MHNAVPNVKKQKLEHTFKIGYTMFSLKLRLKMIFSSLSSENLEIRVFQDYNTLHMKFLK